MAEGDQPAGGLPEEQEERQRQHRGLVLAYKRAFATESGSIVLEDLLNRFGFDKFGVERDSVSGGIDAIGLATRDAVKAPVRHILRMRNVEVKPLGNEKRRGKAKSGLASQA